MERGGVRRIPDLGVAVRRIVVGYRVVAAGWVGLLAVIGAISGRLDPATALLTTGIAVGWAGVTTASAGITRSRAATWAWVAADLLVAAAILLVPAALDGAALPFAGGYPFSAVVVAAWLRGMPGALVAAAWLSAATALRLPLGAEAPPVDLLSTIVFYVLAAAVLAWGLDVLERTAAERDAAQAALVTERADRAVAEQRAAVAAHLHDSVLQTLALIQRRSGDPIEVTGLARAQERALRDWLAGRDEASAVGTLAGALDAVAEEVERLHRLTIDVVHVGDAPLDEGLRIAVAAVREALVNTAKHAEVAEAQVYAEAAAGDVAIFVRDRGVGFDPGAVPADRRGVVGSILGRIEASGGTAEVRSSPGGGTEVEIHMPRAAVADVG